MLQTSTAVHSAEERWISVERVERVETSVRVTAATGR